METTEKHGSTEEVGSGKIPLQRIVMPWYPIEDNLPEAGRKVLATYKNIQNNSRIIIAHRIPSFWAECVCEYDCNCEYDGDRDNYYYPAGFYEQVENWGDISCVYVGDGKITHWMPLPAGLDA